MPHQRFQQFDFHRSFKRLEPQMLSIKCRSFPYNTIYLNRYFLPMESITICYSKYLQNTKSRFFII